MTALSEETTNKLIEMSRRYPKRFRGLPERIPPNDRRLREVRHQDTLVEMPNYRSLDEWRACADWLRRHVLVSNGLWPIPERTPLNPAVFGRIERDEYSVEKVYFESVPGFFVTGNLYRPLDTRTQHPAILNPHGHWPHGRLQNDDACSVPARCISFARQGYVAFSYDMVGFLDSTQVPHYPLPEQVAEYPFLDASSPDESASSDLRDQLWGISLCGLQLWNSIRSLDFLESLPDVAPARIGCTGASGGGTQTFLLTAVDDRVKVSAPVNMISAHFQGGCVCEDPPGLRLGASNLDIAALTAPRPMLLVSATGDWTVNTPTVEYPAIKEIYRLFGAEDRLEWAQVDAGHNYNRESREAVYKFLGRNLLGTKGAADLAEQPVEVETTEDLLVLAGGNQLPSPLTAEDLSRHLVRRAGNELEDLWPRVESDRARFRDVFGPALRHTLSTEWPAQVAADSFGSTEWPELSIERIKLSRPDAGDELPAVRINRSQSPGSRTALVIHSQGKIGLVDPANRRPNPLLQRLLEADYTVLAVDVFLTGEYHTAWGQGGRVQNIRHFTTYNRTDAALRVQDILTSLAYLTHTSDGGDIDLIGIGEAGLWCLLARAVAPVSIRVVADAAQFPIAEDARYVDRLFIPGLRKAGDLRSALALAAPSPTLIHNAGGVFRAAGCRDLYRMLGEQDALVIRDDELGPNAIVEWLGT